MAKNVGMSKGGAKVKWKVFEESNSPRDSAQKQNTIKQVLAF